MYNKTKNEIKIKNIRIFFKKKVTKFGTGAKIDCPKEHLDKDAYVIIIE
jgi:putative transposon-encoded protein